MTGGFASTHRADILVVKTVNMHSDGCFGCSYCHKISPPCRWLSCVASCVLYLMI